MPRFTGAQLKAQFEIDPKGIAHMLGAMMRDFGYPNASDEAVEKEITAQFNGSQPCNLNYGLWLFSYLRNGVD